MSATASIDTTQKVTASLNPTDVNNLPSPVFNQKWTVIPNADGTTGDCTLQPSEDGNKCDVISASDATVTIVQCVANTTPDPASPTISDTGIVAVGVAVQPANTLGMSFGTPQPK